MPSIEHIIPILTLAALLGSGLVAGIFFAFSTFIMKALDRVQPESGMRVMQEINVTSQKAEEQESTFSIEIECDSQIEVGKPIGCSFKNSGTPDTVNWSASGGQPSSGSGDSFQTTFEATGQYSIGLEACQASNCISDSQTINVVEPKQSSSGE